MKKTLKAITAFALAAVLAGCSGGSKASGEKTIKVGATAVPHAELLENIVKDVLAKDGWTLEVVTFQDYVLPNTSLDAKELDANYFQTLGYMKNQNEERGLHLVAAAGVHIEPMGFYSSKITDLKDLKNGASIGIPNDTDNEIRAVDLLVAKGLLKDPGTEYTPENLNTVFAAGSAANPNGYVLEPIEAASLPTRLDDLDGAVINGNYALEAKLPEKHPAIFIESFDADTTVKRTNFIVVNEGTENSDKIQALIKAIQSDDVKKFIEDTYKGAVIPSFIGAQK